MNKRVGLIGCGAIGAAIIRQWPEAGLPDCELAAVLVRPERVLTVPPLPGGSFAVHTDIEAFLASGLDIVLEAAGHAAVAQYGERILGSGIEFCVISVGSLVDEALRARLLQAAEAGAGRLVVPVGAIAGLDGLAALRYAGLHSVHYLSSKPPMAWMGTPAESLFDLPALTERTVIFSGNAADAARLYPRNANLAAAVAFAGLGLERTQVTLAADPALRGNEGRIEAQAQGSRLSVVVSGNSDPANPKTSQTAAMSLLAALQRRTGVLTFT
ncbi:aspartate dehydrogenase [Orrella sp. JC864]|uniref:aspartate dehydrogenase n=1 Tax=Orrella sp. JC864 TaxID=3120298 RepID=UPI0012BB6D49